MAAREPPHWMAVDRCFPLTERAAAMAYTRARLTELEGRVIHRVEVEAALVVCPQDHGWARVQPCDRRCGTCGNTCRWLLGARVMSVYVNIAATERVYDGVLADASVGEALATPLPLIGSPKEAPDHA